MKQSSRGVAAGSDLNGSLTLVKDKPHKRLEFVRLKGKGQTG